MPKAYEEAGVSVEAGYEVVKRIKSHVARTNRPGVVKGVAHITGGGFIENIPRLIPDGLAAHINLGSWPVLPIFDVLEKAGSIDHMEMFNIFNMGIGMVLAVSAEDADKTMELLKSNGEAGYVLGNIVKKTGEDVELQ